MKKTKVITMLILLTLLFTACNENANIADVTKTSKPTIPTEITPSPNIFPIIEETIFTRDIPEEEKEKALEQLYIKVKEHFAAWNDFTFEDWKAEYPIALERALATDNVYDFYMEMKRFMVLLNDHHSEVSFPDSFYNDIWITPIHFIYVDGAFYILGGAADTIEKLPQYSKIVKIDGVPIDTYMEEKIYPYVWHGKLNTASSSATYLACQGPMNTSQSFEVVTLEGETTAAEIKRVPQSKLMDNWVTYRLASNVKWGVDIFSSNLLTITRIDNDYIYIQIPHFNDKDIAGQFEKHLDVLKEAKGIILDVRGNTGGNAAYATQIARHFIDGAFPDVYAEKSVYDSKTDNYSLKEIQLPQFQGTGDIATPVVVLQDYLTFSAGEHFLDFMSFAQNAVFVGTESAGATGDPQWVELPEGGKARISQTKIFRHDKTPFLNIGIQPDIFAGNSIEDYIAESNRILNAGLEELHNICDNN